MWEVDPETRAKLAAIQKESKNNLCCDCNAPSPQWASPKFGVFICLSCAGVHRGLGVHISFVRSISMDAFKQIEIERMRLGGNENWKTFFEQHEDTKMRGVTWDDATNSPIRPAFASWMTGSVPRPRGTRDRGVARHRSC
ncbi:ADP-ribosylation factor GTPase-activating protein GCS1 like [Verticillium longisporum]|nr:ADP-ribosylation factor GTPase-activating protein GCS1 like [Verticillium longisporum]